MDFTYICNHLVDFISNQNIFEPAYFINHITGFISNITIDDPDCLGDILEGLAKSFWDLIKGIG